MDRVNCSTIKWSTNCLCSIDTPAMIDQILLAGIWGPCSGRSVDSISCWDQIFCVSNAVALIHYSKESQSRSDLFASSKCTGSCLLSNFQLLLTYYNKNRCIRLLFDERISERSRKFRFTFQWNFLHSITFVGIGSWVYCSQLLQFCNKESQIRQTRGSDPRLDLRVH